MSAIKHHSQYHGKQPSFLNRGAQNQSNHGLIENTRTFRVTFALTIKKIVKCVVIHYAKLLRLVTHLTGLKPLSYSVRLTVINQNESVSLILKRNGVFYSLRKNNSENRLRFQNNVQSSLVMSSKYALIIGTF